MSSNIGRVAAAGVLACLLVACGGASPDVTDATTTTSGSVTTPAGAPASTSPPTGSSLGNTGACDRTDPAELGELFGETFEEGMSMADGTQCLFDGAPTLQVLMIAVQGDERMCVLLGRESDAVDFDGVPGWWDVGSGQGRACLHDGAVAVMISGGGGDNSAYRDTVLELVSRAMER